MSSNNEGLSAKSYDAIHSKSYSPVSSPTAATAPKSNGADAHRSSVELAMSVPFLVEPGERASELKDALPESALAYDDSKHVAARLLQAHRKLIALEAMPELGAESSATNPELVLGTSNFLPAWFLERGAQLSKAVCKIETEGVDYLGRPGEWMGTGFLISPNILLTNHTCSIRWRSPERRRASSTINAAEAARTSPPSPSR